MFNGKTAFISGGSRGIGLEIGLALARQGANVAIAAKTASPHPKLPGTVYTACQSIEAAGGKALPLIVDIRDAEAVENAIEKTVQTFGGLDILINNASAIAPISVEELSVKQYDLMNNINARGTFVCSKFAIPHLLRSHQLGRNPHILTLSPVLRDTITQTESFAGKSGYALAKMGMSLLTLGLAGELEGKVGVNALWPLTPIATVALRIAAPSGDWHSRDPGIMAEAALVMLKKDGRQYTSNFEIDENFLRKNGYTSQHIQKWNPPGIKDEELHLDFWIPQWVKDEAETLRRNDSPKSKL